jgi:hypothetical protein
MYDRSISRLELTNTLNMQAAIMDAKLGMVTIYTLPEHLNTPKSQEEYVERELLTADDTYIIAPSITLYDLRTKQLPANAAPLARS